MQDKSLYIEFERFGYSNHTNCIHSDNINLIETDIVSIFEKQGYVQIDRPTLPFNSGRLINKLKSSTFDIDSYFLVIGIHKGNFGWTVIKSSRLELFCTKSRETNCLFLSTLAQKHKSNIFHHTVAERNWGLLIEADTCGNIKASGNIEAEYLEDLKFAQDIIINTNNNQNFSLIEIPKEFQTAGQLKTFLSKHEKQKREKELEILYEQGEQDIRKKPWSEWKKLNMSDFERIDEDLGKLICKSNYFWHENNLLYRAYAEPEKLEQDGVKLLFFQTGRFDLDPTTEEIWSPITQRKDYNLEREIPF